MPYTTLEQLTETHETNTAAIVTKLGDNLHWNVNPNVFILHFHMPQFEKQLGRSAKVYKRLTRSGG